EAHRHAPEAGADARGARVADLIEPEKILLQAAHPRRGQVARREHEPHAHVIQHERPPRARRLRPPAAGLLDGAGLGLALGADALEPPRELGRVELARLGAGPAKTAASVRGPAELEDGL